MATDLGALPVTFEIARTLDGLCRDFEKTLYDLDLKISLLCFVQATMPAVITKETAQVISHGVEALKQCHSAMDHYLRAVRACALLAFKLSANSAAK